MQRLREQKTASGRRIWLQRATAVRVSASCALASMRMTLVSCLGALRILPTVLFCFSISATAQSLDLRSNLTIGGSPEDILINKSRERLYIAHAGNGLSIVDVDVAGGYRNPSVVNSLSLGATVATCVDQSFIGDQAVLVGTTDSGLFLVDVRNESNLQVVDRGDNNSAWISAIGHFNDYYVIENQKLSKYRVNTFNDISFAARNSTFPNILVPGPNAIACDGAYVYVLAASYSDCDVGLHLFDADDLHHVNHYLVSQNGYNLQDVMFQGSTKIVSGYFGVAFYEHSGSGVLNLKLLDTDRTLFAATWNQGKSLIGVYGSTITLDVLETAYSGPWTLHEVGYLDVYSYPWTSPTDDLTVIDSSSQTSDKTLVVAGSATKGLFFIEQNLASSTTTQRSSTTTYPSTTTIQPRTTTYRSTTTYNPVTTTYRSSSTTSIQPRTTTYRSSSTTTYVAPRTTTYRSSTTTYISGDAWDPTDDSASTAPELPWMGTTEQSHGPHTLSSTDHHDWFQAYLWQGTRYQFGSTGSSDVYGELYSDVSGSTRVAYNDDGGVGANFSFSYTAPTTDLYYLRVRAFNVGNSAAYTLTFKKDTPGGDQLAYVQNTSPYLTWHVDDDMDLDEDRSFQYAVAGDRPVVGDVDGSADDNVAITRDYTGMLVWHCDLTGNGSTDMIFSYGQAGDRAVSGDVDGDGNDDIVITRDYGGMLVWHCDLDGNGSTDMIFAYGESGDHAVLGDIDGDGTDDIAITRDYNGVLAWHVDTDRNGSTDIIFAYGQAGDWGVSGNIEEARP